MRQRQKRIIIIIVFVPLLSPTKPIAQSKRAAILRVPSFCVHYWFWPVISKPTKTTSTMTVRFGAVLLASSERHIAIFILAYRSTVSSVRPAALRARAARTRRPRPCSSTASAALLAPVASFCETNETRPCRTKAR